MEVTISVQEPDGWFGGGSDGIARVVEGFDWQMGQVLLIPSCKHYVHRDEMKGNAKHGKED